MKNYQNTKMIQNKDISLSYIIYGCFYMFLEYSDTVNEMELIQIVDKLNKKVLQ